MDPPYLSKTDFLNYLVCPAYAWMAAHRPEVLPEDEDPDRTKRIQEQSQRVEEYALERHPDVRRVHGFGQKGAEATKRMISEQAPAIYQGTVISPEGFMVKFDILVREGAGWQLHEVKSSNGLRDKDVPDVTFQKFALERAGLKITGVKLVHLNRNYARKGKLDPRELITVTDADKAVQANLQKIEKAARLALDNLRNPLGPTTCTCDQRRHNHCPLFSYFHPEVPEYSVFNVSGLGAKVLKDLVSRKQFEVTDIPDGVQLKGRGQHQVVVAKEGKPIIKDDAIKRILDSFEFPLYFLDYETTTGAFPLFDGCRPYLNMPFQYSLHVLDEPDAEPQHREFLAAADAKEPVQELVESLRQAIGLQGTVLAWNKRFEMGCNETMAGLYPPGKAFLEDVNRRTFDLAEVFFDHHYLHPEFQGRWTIKKILPVLVPELSYDGLAVREGSTASALWEDAVQGKIAGAELDQLYADLRKYCTLDTLAMVRIYQHLVEICRKPPPAA